METHKKVKSPPKYLGIGARLTQFIEASDQPNARQFALRAGLTPQLVSHLMAGNSIPSGETLMALATAYRTFDSDWLLTGRAKDASTEPEPPLPTSPTERRAGLPATPGTATPQEADFVGKYITQLEAENARQAGMIEWLQEQNRVLLGKSPASAQAAAHATQRQVVTGFAPTAAEGKVVAMYPEPLKQVA